MHKLIWPVAFVAAFVIPVYARAQAPVEYTIKLPGPELDVVGEGLGGLPYVKAAPILNKIREQVQEQQKKVEVPVNNNTVQLPTKPEKPKE